MRKFVSTRRAVSLAGLGLLLAAAISPGAEAGEADVIAVEISGSNPYTFHVTVRHADEGWEHYADQFTVLAPDGTELGVRVLAHPHEHEQPFTRSLSGVQVPPGVMQVTVGARDSEHGTGGKTLTVELPR